MQGPPSPSGSILHAQSQGPNQKRNRSIKTNLQPFDSLVACCYPAVYNSASRLTDPPREAVLLTYGLRKQLWSRDEVRLVIDED